jgi:hypothetical protein
LRVFSSAARGIDAEVARATLAGHRFRQGKAGRPRAQRGDVLVSPNITDHKRTCDEAKGLAKGIVSKEGDS